MHLVGHDSNLISIIIATYNRAAYILDTLNSIRNQTYKNWECIIIDDGSLDNTPEVVLNYIRNDKRFQYYIRPKEIKKGANACRNYGYLFSKGDYIKFFDSDDIMLKEHLKVLINEIEENELDFAVGDCQNFDETGLLKRPYEIDRKTAVMSAKNFAFFITGWITNDLLVSKKYADKLKFAEEIRDQASEYQYNIKLLCLTTNGKLVDKVLTHRRIHPEGFVESSRRNKIWVDQMNAELKIKTLTYLEDIADKSLLRWFLKGNIQLNFRIASDGFWPEHIYITTKKLAEYFGIKKASLYPLAILFGFFFAKGYNVIKYIRS